MALQSFPAGGTAELATQVLTEHLDKHQATRFYLFKALGLTEKGEPLPGILQIVLANRDELAEVIHRRAPWKTKESVKLATLEWVA